MTDVHTAAIIIARLTKRRKKIIRVKHVTVFKNFPGTKKAKFQKFYGLITVLFGEK